MQATNLNIFIHLLAKRYVKFVLLGIGIGLITACSGSEKTKKPQTPKADVSIITPSTFFKAGGEVVISGKNLKNSIISFGAANLTPTVQTNNLVKVLLPAKEAGTYQLKIDNIEESIRYKGFYTKVASKDNHICGILPNKTVECWGEIAHSNTRMGVSLAPKLVPNLAQVMDIAVGQGHACALLKDKTIKCWGKNDKGQLGNNTQTFAQEPVFVVTSDSDTAALANVKSIAAGYSHTCAVLTGASNIKCWGANERKQIDNSGKLKKVPTNSISITDAEKLELGEQYSCVLSTGNEVKCWGANIGGTGEKGETRVNGNFTALSAGKAHACAVTNTSHIKCWGENDFGQLGNKTTTKVDIDSPVDVHTASNASTPLVGAASVSAGSSHTCVKLTNNQFKCWGKNNKGQLGDGTTNQSTTPLDLPKLKNVPPLILGSDYSCVNYSDKPLHCWGQNNTGQLGNGSRTSSTTPVAVMADSWTQVVANIDNAKQLVGGASHSCAVLLDGKVKCWGVNNEGQLGNGETSSSPVSAANAVLVNGINNATEIALGKNYSCALLKDKTVKCWGGSASNYTGQLGDGNNKKSLAPVAVKNISTAIAVGAGDSSACALLEDKTVKCWGKNDQGQLGNNSFDDKAEPVGVYRLSDVIQLALHPAANHGCALLANKTVKCWGFNHYGQLGDEKLAASGAPVAISGLADVIQIAVGEDHSCALLADKSIKCWGKNDSGQLGDNDTKSESKPVTVIGMNNVAKLALGSGHSCALLEDRTVKCWGSNQFGQLGDGTSVNSKIPVLMKSYKGKVDDLSAGNRQTLLLQGSLILPVGK